MNGTRHISTILVNVQDVIDVDVRFNYNVISRFSSVFVNSLFDESQGLVPGVCGIVKIVWIYLISVHFF